MKRVIASCLFLVLLLGACAGFAESVYVNPNVEDFERQWPTAFSEYFPLLRNSDYTVVIAVRDEASRHFGSVKEYFQSLGLNANLEDNFRNSYLAVISKGQVVYEQLSEKALVYMNTLSDGLDCVFLSAGYLSGHNSAIIINGYDYCLNRRGINIVVYDHREGKVVDSAGIDTFSGEEAIYRKAPAAN